MEARKSSEEFKVECVTKMGEEVGNTYYNLWQEIAIIHFKWDEYSMFYGTKPSRIELLNNTGPKFFGLVQDMFLENIILHIARLVDPAESGKKKMNLSFNRLYKVISDTKLSSEVEKLCNEAKEATKSCKDLRDKRIAHRDLEIALGNSEIKLKYNSRKEIKNILNLLVKILNTVSKYYLGSTTIFDLGNDGDSKKLLRIIYKSLITEKIEREQLKKGIISDNFNIADL